MTLLTLLRHAAGPNRELDAEIAEAAGFQVERHASSGLVLCRKPPEQYSWTDIPAYTGSLDAAMTLMPEGSQWTLEADAAWVRLLTMADVDEFQGHFTGRGGKCTALALCIAALLARGIE